MKYAIGLTGRACLYPKCPDARLHIHYRSGTLTALPWQEPEGYIAMDPALPNGQRTGKHTATRKGA